MNLTRRNKMSIQTTKSVTREFATGRIKLIADLANNMNFLGLEGVTYESDCDIVDFVKEPREDLLSELYMNNIDKWTNRMLETVLNKPFIRETMFDNYNVGEN
jgi:hypothetical protein